MSIERIDRALVGAQEFDPTRRQAELDGKVEGPSFGGVFENAVQEVNELQHQADERVNAFVRGEDVPLHQVVLAQEEAEISFRLMLGIRDQLVRAYHEILRTPM